MEFATSLFPSLEELLKEEWTERNDNLIREGRNAARSLYSYSLEFLDAELLKTKKSVFRELLVDGFDAEQIWSQFKRFSDVSVKILEQNIKQFDSSFSLLSTETEKEIDDLLQSEEGQSPEPIEDSPSEAAENEDDFFDLSDMRDFVEQAEQELDEDEEDQEDALNDQEEKAGNEIMYSDLYGQKSRSKRETKKSRLQRERENIKTQIESLEDEAIAEKEWPFRGEVSASHRPLNSALEVDLDYDTSVQPPPKPTQADLDSIESLIKRRIAERKFDDVQRLVQPSIEENKALIKLDDSKAKKGLAELYEDEYIKNAHGVGSLAEKEEKLRIQARRLFKEACASIDALTHFHFAPRPVVEDLSIRVGIQSVRMEEGGPSAVSKAPEEIFIPENKSGEAVNPKELTKSEKKSIRAKQKRQFKKSETSKQTSSKIRGRKSLTERQSEAGRKRRRLLSGQDKTRSTFFEKLQSIQENPMGPKKPKQKSTRIKL